MGSEGLPARVAVSIARMNGSLSSDILVVTKSLPVVVDTNGPGRNYLKLRNGI